MYRIIETCEIIKKNVSIITLNLQNGATRITDYKVRNMNEKSFLLKMTKIQPPAKIVRCIKLIINSLSWLTPSKYMVMLVCIAKETWSSHDFKARTNYVRCKPYTLYIHKIMLIL